MRTEIKTRREFETYLNDAHAKMEMLVSREPNDKTLAAVLRQLDAIEQWTANGQNMTQSQKDRIVMGLQALREMADFVVEQDLVCALHSFIESRMPTAPSLP